MKVGVAILAVLVVVGGIGGVAYVQASDQLSRDIEQRMETSAETEAAATSQWVALMRAETHALSHAGAVQSDDPDEVSAFLAGELEAGTLPSGVVAVHYLDTASSTYRGSSATDAVGTDPAEGEAPWVDGVGDVASETVLVSDPYAAPDGTPVVAFVTSVPDQPDRALVMVADLEGRAEAMPRPGRQSFTKVVDDDGMTVLSHRTDQILRPNMGERGVDSMAVMKGLDGQSGYMEMEMGGEPMTMGYAPVEGTDWVVMTHSPKGTMFGLQQQISRDLLLLLGSALLGFGLVGVVVGRNTTRELDRLTSKADALEDGESAAMTRIAEGFNEMAKELESTLLEIQRFADEVATSSADVTTNTADVEAASEEVSESVLEISAGADRQLSRLEDVSGEMQRLSGAIEEVATSVDQVATTTSEAAELGEEGRRSATEAIDEMETIETKTDETVAEVESLAEEVDEVSEIVDLIADVAEQTNILALNASIEAARAGEAGEGFAVVADEVKDLASEAADATERIERLIGDIERATTEAVTDMREMGERVSDGADTVDDALVALEELARQVDEADTGVREINEAADEQTASTEEVVSMLEDVTDVAEQTSEEAGDASAAAEEQAATATTVTDSTRTLAEEAAELKERLERFTGGGPRAGDAGDGRSTATSDGGYDDGA